ncbi:hypothetical protein BGW36DRAFT_390292 [Talaromyces proteolyticus]|uniref:Uncharacterized protein n=1 Tax=Talaromyces proteolyticus TaxID=1131652 RepID=A0AAD4KE80_9EURO|nr:uncharacterized protein BGW36DRAFT_390292 [Talaromyces proteolyticus]KAH8690152.1 hypothetical protein BGW36DRAFT_390292 [Talaromyces proteolyticus]
MQFGYGMPFFGLNTNPFRWVQLFYRIIPCSQCDCFVAIIYLHAILSFFGLLLSAPVLQSPAPQSYLGSLVC